MRESPLIVRAEQPGNYRPSRTWPAGRTCAADGCGATLSRYNHRDTCAIHTPEGLDHLAGGPLRQTWRRP